MGTRRAVAVVIGGGAAGFFGAISCAEANRGQQVILLEKTKQLLSKVRISGGGRCNVTHHCFDPTLLVQHYPRGGKELRAAFTRFQPRDTINWFQSQGVELKAESDGRMFPTTDDSETIISCLLKKAQALAVDIRLTTTVTDCMKEKEGFLLLLSNGETLPCDRLLVATGGASKVQGWLKKLGHTFTLPVPSLFTFNTPHALLHELAGVSVPKATLSLENSPFQQTAPLLLTHWGMSGPAVLKLSSWGARFLHEKNYRVPLKVNWLPDFSEQEIKNRLIERRQQQTARFIANDSPFDLPKSLWKVLLQMTSIPSELRWATFSKQQITELAHILHASLFQIEGKNTYKEEFVTCGGIKLQEVDFKTMESRLCPGLYFAGEILDIDGVTGGFNFQSAWTTSWLAGQTMAKPLSSRLRNHEPEMAKFCPKFSQ